MGGMFGALFLIASGERGSSQEHDMADEVDTHYQSWVNASISKEMVAAKYDHKNHYVSG